ncbi:MAG: hypothetical protein KGM24_13565 [Elusimicrobia bacterium]|nr:hypothetical protein [Elusimicrobiota bacterium]
MKLSSCAWLAAGLLAVTAAAVSARRLERRASPTSFTAAGENLRDAVAEPVPLGAGLSGRSFAPPPSVLARRSVSDAQMDALLSSRRRRGLAASVSVQ